MKIVYAGTPEFAVAPLQKIIEAGYEVVGVITQADKPQGRKGILTPPPVKTFALNTWRRLRRLAGRLCSLARMGKF